MFESKLLEELFLDIDVEFALFNNALNFNLLFSFERFIKVLNKLLDKFLSLTFGIFRLFLL